MKKFLIIIGSLFIIGAIILFIILPGQQQQKHIVEVISTNQVFTKEYETAVFAGGCFWCIESAFQETPGVTEAISGYIGGAIESAYYQDVVSGTTRHREAVWVSYNPQEVSYEELLNVFWERIDPTDPEGQFADRGYQYTTAVYYYIQDQQDHAEHSRRMIDVSERFENPVVTEILPVTDFYIAEEYHQDFYQKSSDHYKAYEFFSGRTDFVNEFWQ